MSGPVASGPSPQASVGRRVVVTRPDEQAVAWVRALRALGVDAVAVPLIGILPATDLAAVDAAWPRLSQWSLLVFVSPNAVSQLFARRPPGVEWPADLLVAAPGPGTSAVLRAHGVAGDCVIEPAADSANFDSEALWLQLRHRDWQGKRVLIMRGESGRNWLAEQLRAAGAEVQFLAVYRRGAAAMPAAMQQTMQLALTEPERHLWFFSSSEAIIQLQHAAALPAAELRTALGRSSALATHPRIADNARAAGFATVLQARPGIADVVACIQSAAKLDFSSASRSSL